MQYAVQISHHGAFIQGPETAEFPVVRSKEQQTDRTQLIRDALLNLHTVNPRYASILQ